MSSSTIIDSTTSAVQSVSQLIAILQSATPTEAADILAVLDRGLPLWGTRKEMADAASSSTHAAHVEGTPVKTKTPKEPAAPKKPKAEKVAIALPEAVAGAPDASEYRVDPDMFDASTCIARITKGGEDKRWKPIIFRESQCGGKLVEGSDLCAKCCKREEKYAADPKPGDWCGRLTEEPLDWQHMLGTSWADEKKPRFLASASVSSAASVADETASENGSAVEMPAPSAAQKSKPDAAAKAAATAAKLAEKAATAAAAKAAKEAEKEAAKAAKLAAKEAEKAAKVAEKDAAKAAKSTKAKATDAAVVKAVKPKAKKAAVAVVAAPVEVEGELKLIDGTLYMVKKGNVFEYDELTEKAGDFVGRITADETIDTEAEEVTAAESDTD